MNLVTSGGAFQSEEGKRTPDRRSFYAEKRRDAKGVERGLVDAVDEDHALFVVNFLKADFDDFRVTGLDGAADILRFDGHFAVAAVDEHAERNALGPAEVEEAIHGGANGAPGVEDIVDEHEIHAVDGKIDVRGLQNGLWRDFGEVVTVKSDVEGADRNFYTVDTAHRARDTLSQGDAAAANADEGQIAGAATFFDDLMSEALQGAVDFRRRHQLTLLYDSHSGVNANTS